MNKIYPNTWLAENGASFENGQPTENYLYWLKETAVLTDTQWKKGIDHLKKLTGNNFVLDKPNFPPSADEFLAICKPVRGHAHRQLSDPLHPQHEEWQRSRMIESDEIKERKAAAGESALSAMKGLFR